MKRMTFDGEFAYRCGKYGFIIPGGCYDLSAFFEHHIKPPIGQPVRLTIEIEEVSLRDRVAKIFDEGLFYQDPFYQERGFSLAPAISLLKDRVLAEFDKEQQTK